MKAILGRKVGMTQVFLDDGRSMPATVIEVQPNVITKISTIESDGYNSIQLAIGDIKPSRQKKPEIGHFKKANTTPKRFIKEIRNFEGEFKLGDVIDVSIFAPGELVDVIGNSKGKGFAGTIKRHNQSIGPKSHGGGGGSKPVRLTGSLGDISGNKVVKGMTMPGQLGNRKATQQNLEIILLDVANNLILVKGSIPGPNKSFVIVRDAVKGLPNKEPMKLVDVHEAVVKNELLEEAKKAGADVNTDMSVEEMRTAIDAALEAKKAAEEAEKAKEEAEALKSEKEKVEAAAEKAKEEAEKAAASGDEEKAKEAQEKAAALEKAAEAVETKAKEAKAEAQEAEQEAAAKEAEAEKLQVEEEPEEAEEAETKEEEKDGGEK